MHNLNAAHGKITEEIKQRKERASKPCNSISKLAAQFRTVQRMSDDS
jgi:hypothetical protein